MENNIDKNQFLARWLNDDLTEEEEAFFKKDKDYELYKKIEKYSSLLETPHENKDILGDIISKSKQGKRKPNYQWVYAAAASIVIFLGLFYGLRSNTISFETSVGEHLSVFLPDSSEVVLNGNSKLEYSPSNWKNDERALSLDGEAFFKVKKGSLFAVNTREGNVEVLGTQFNVNSHANTLEVKCYSGKVKVYKNDKQTILTKGNAYRILDDKDENWLFKVNQKSWLDDEYNFYKTPLSKVFSSLENQFNITIHNKERYLNKRFTGGFSNENKNIAIKTVLEAMAINFKENNNTIILE